MNRSFVAAAALALTALATTAQADVNVAATSTVTLSGEHFGNDLPWWSTGTLQSPSTLIDGVVLAEGTQWNQGSVFWSQYGAEADTITFTLAGAASVTSLFAQVDTNDDYAVSYRDMAGSWHDLTTLSPERSWGLRSVSVLLDMPVIATAFQVKASGDNAYAMSEFSAFGAPVPEASTYLMMLAGLIAFGTFRSVRDRRNQNSR